ncbi:hypothetical protein U0R22_000833 [Mesorhizobium huakuii]|uniref:Uncharacterized protein n=1 Tax=Mesorhizobium huakuii TaxID=28104 RepID=A0ABZ0VH37_9HYPH|nr:MULTISPECIES: hypothetical protein [Mesorhizobium]WQB96769.1 hypothetical protein U0R22_000833 [Mesorhizobium huakuii]
MALALEDLDADIAPHPGEPSQCQKTAVRAAIPPQPAARSSAVRSGA